MSYGAWVQYIGDEDAALDLWNDAMESGPIPSAEPSPRAMEAILEWRAAYPYVRALDPDGRPIW